MDRIQKKENNQCSIMAPGFTLVELMISLAIVSIGIGIATPFFQSYAINANLKSATREILVDFATLKERALAENRTFTIVFDAPNNRYTIQDGTTNLVKTPSYFGRDISLTNAAFGGGTAVSFQARGIATPAGNIGLSNSRGSSATITVNVAGRTNVQICMQ